MYTDGNTVSASRNTFNFTQHLRNEFRAKNYIRRPLNAINVQKGVACTVVRLVRRAQKMKNKKKGRQGKPGRRKVIIKAGLTFKERIN